MNFGKVCSVTLCLCVQIPLCLSGCALVAPTRGVPVPEAHGSRAHDLRVSETESPFAAKRPVPVLAAPEVFPAFAPARLDRARDVLVGEHWIFLKLRDAEWFLEKRPEPEPPVRGDATERDLEPLRLLRLEDAVVPWRGVR